MRRSPRFRDNPRASRDLGLARPTEARDVILRHRRRVLLVLGFLTRIIGTRDAVFLEGRARALLVLSGGTAWSDAIFAFEATAGDLVADLLTCLMVRRNASGCRRCTITWRGCAKSWPKNEHASSEQGRDFPHKEFPSFFPCLDTPTGKKRSATGTPGLGSPFLGLTWDTVRLPRRRSALASRGRAIHILEYKGPIAGRRR
jgi:hypothetical protein